MISTGSKNLQRYLIAAGLLIALAALSTGCKEKDQVWQQAVERGTLRVGMDAAYPPFENVDQNGQIAGFDVDLAMLIGERLGLEIEIVNISYDGLYDALYTEQVDVLISALVPAYMYEHKADFSVPYFNAGEMLIVPVGSSIESMDDLTGHRLAVEYGSGGDVEARKWERRIADLTIARYDDPDSAINAVIDGEADAALVDGITAQLGVGSHEELSIADAVTDETLFAIAVPPDSLVLLDEINRVLNELLEDGSIDQLIEKWFGVSAPG